MTAKRKKSVENEDLARTLHCLLYSQPGFHHTGLILRTVFGHQSTSGVAISSSLGEGHFVREIAKRYKSHLFRYQSAHASTNEDGLSGALITKLSNRDTDVIASTHVLNDAHVALKLRKLDSLFPPCGRKIDVLHLAEPAKRIQEIIAGAVEIMRRDRPLIVLEMHDSSACQLLAMALSECDYVLLDSTFTPVTLVDDKISSLMATETYFVAAHRNFLSLAGVSASLWPHGEFWSAEYSWQENLIACFSREARQGGIQFSGARFEKTSYKFDEKIHCRGFYPPEYGNGNENVWRWLGPRRSAEVSIPNPGVGTYDLRLTVLGYVSDRNIAELRVFCGGQELRLDTVDIDGLVVVSTRLFVSPLDVNEALDFVISVPSVSRGGQDDPRFLGICLTNLEISRA